jgi:lipoate-protein ligase A
MRAINDLHLAEPWRLLPHSAGPAQDELSAAEALLAGLLAAPQAALRWYEAPGPALVLGSGQKIAEVSLEACAAAGVSLHRRASGGTAVLFVPGFLMQDIVLPPGHPLALADVSESYRWLGSVWADTLSRLGIAAVPVDVATARADTSAASPLLRRACFGGRSPYELLAGGRKLVGFSQVRRRHGTLFQVGIYTRWPGAALAGLLRLEPGQAQDLTAGLAERVAGLAELLAPPPAPAAIIAAFAQALAAAYGAPLAAAGWRDDELAAHRAALPRYAPLPLSATMAPDLAS